MTVEELAAMVIDACEQEQVEHMLTGAFAHGLYGIPRSTMDEEVVLSLAGANPIQRVARRLAATVEFEPQIQFDTLTWGKRQVGQSFTNPPFKVELFELFDERFCPIAVSEKTTHVFEPDPTARLATHARGCGGAEAPLGPQQGSR
jgi:hypothetical protein